MSEKEINYDMLASSGYPVQELKAGATIFKEGDDGDYMFIVRSGEVEIKREGKVVATVGPKGMFGEMALIDGSPRSADASAKSDCELVAVNERGFIFLVTETPYFAINVMRTLADRLRAMNTFI
ncbi:MAG: cyclic nucleotide-binding domain-containing protein [Pseudomonadota bacterium]